MLLNPPEPPGDPNDDWRDDPEAVAWVKSVRATAPPPPATPPDWPPLDLDPEGGVETDMTPAEWNAYWETLERDGEGRPDVEPDAGQTRGNDRAAA